MRLIQAFCETAARSPKKIALITEKSQLSFEDLLDLTRACEAALWARGLRQGMRVVLDSDRPEFLVAFSLLLSRHSLTVVFAPTAQVLAAEIEFDFLVGTAPNVMVSPARQIVIEPDWFAALGTESPGDYSEAFGEGGEFVHTTSGTTGTPKFVLSQEANRLGGGIGPYDEIDGEQMAALRSLSTISVQMSWGLSLLLRVLLAGGSVVALSEHRNRPLPYIDLYGVTHVTTTPVVVRQMMDLDNARQYLGSLRAIRVSGAFVGNDLLLGLSQLTCARIYIGYGAAEFGGLSAGVYDASQARPEGYVGELRRADVEIAFFDERMDLLPGVTEGIVGLRVSGRAPDRRYLNPAAGDGRSGFIDGYFFPGDIMRREGQSLYIIGRVKNVINVSGNKISLDAVQAVLMEVLAVMALGCLAAPDDMGLETLVVAYAATEDISAGAVQAVLDARFPGLKLGRMVRRAALPLNPSGKIDLARLRAELL